jgi:hypothetical protein
LLAAFDDQIVSRLGTTTSQYLNSHSFIRTQRRRSYYLEDKYDIFDAEFVRFNQRNILDSQIYAARTAQGEQTVVVSGDQLSSG